MRSISARLLGGSAIVLAIFILLMGLSISYSVHKRAETALFDRLQGLIYGIVGASDIDEDGTLVVNPNELPDSRLNTATSGLYAEVVGNEGNLLWQSASTAENIPPVSYSPIGKWVYQRIESPSSKPVHRLQLASVWELDNGNELPFIVQAVADSDVLTGQLRRFDRTLWISLLVSAAGLLLVQLWLLKRSLKPLVHIGKQVKQIEQGERDALDEHVPREIVPLASSINTLITSEQNRHQQYRYLLDDLAHSLKTPLSVLNNLAHDMDQSASDSTGNAEHADIVKTQARRMQDTVQGYLHRAASRAPQYLARPTSPLPVIERLCDSLVKIYAAPERTFSIEVPASFLVRIAETDQYEILGNILDNACKFGASSVHIQAHVEDKALVIDDNGPGFPANLLAQLTERGVRADSEVEGQGLGLAASRDLLVAYGGELELGANPRGGARVTLKFA